MGENFKRARENLTQILIVQGILKTPSVIRSMRTVPREEFVTRDLRDHAYLDTPLPIGYGQTISAPQD